MGCPELKLRAGNGSRLEADFVLLAAEFHSMAVTLAGSAERVLLPCLP
jgi:hypothetical protein